MLPGSMYFKMFRSAMFNKDMICGALYIDWISPINPIQDGLFRGFSRMWGKGGEEKRLSFRKNWHTCPSVMKLGLS